jgi:transcriptional regulator with XRE-family HTH domain
MMSGSPTGSEFGKVIRREREQAGLSQARLAEFIGKSPSALRSWEQGRSRPAEVASVRALAAVLGLNEAELIETAGFEPSPEADPRPTLEQELISLASDRTVMLPVADPHGWSRPSPFDADPEPVVEEVGPPQQPPPAVVNNGASPARKVTTVAPPVPFYVQSPSYLEDTEEKEFYRRRWALTAGMTVFLVVVFLWALDNTFGAIGDFISDFIESFNI